MAFPVSAFDAAHTPVNVLHVLPPHWLFAVHFAQSLFALQYPLTQLAFVAHVLPLACGVVEPAFEGATAHTFLVVSQ